MGMCPPGAGDTVPLGWGENSTGTKTAPWAAEAGAGFNGSLRVFKHPTGFTPPPTLAACSAAGHPNGAIVGPGTPAPACVSLLSDCVYAFLFTNVFLIYLQIFFLSSIPERTSRNLKILRKKKEAPSVYLLIDRLFLL